MEVDSAGIKIHYTHISDIVSVSDLSKLARTAKIAARSEYSRFRVGAAIYKGSRFFAGAPNVIKDSPHVPPDRKSIHAEVNTIRQCGSSAKGATLYVVRLDRFNNAVNGRPCNWCLPRIIDAGIQRVVFSTDEGWDSYRTDML